MQSFHRLFLLRLRHVDFQMLRRIGISVRNGFFQIIRQQNLTEVSPGFRCDLSRIQLLQLRFHSLDDSLSKGFISGHNDALRFLVVLRLSQ